MTERTEKRPELIIALVCPLGASIDALELAVAEELATFGYRYSSIRLSTLLEYLAFWQPEPDKREETRISHRQDYAFQFRKLGGPDVLARAALTAIRKCRLHVTGHPDKPAHGHAFILRQLKHPREVQFLRRVYGQSVVVVAGHAPEKTRIDALADKLAQRHGKASGDKFETLARGLIHTDEKERHPDDEEANLGQNARATYPLADVFVNLTYGSGDAVRRFIQLLFGHPFHSPTPEEMAMHQANAMALRSSDERRQVGAVIVTRINRPGASSIMDADIVASGMNEVPRRQGGFYWHEESPDGRDQALRQRNQGVDLEDRIKADALSEIVVRLKRNAWLAPAYADVSEMELTAKLLPLLKKTQFTDISEFMRQVHAEMAALVDAAKRGVAVRGAEMYVTTFPCHNCAKHIVAAGIRKVIYLEPYPKSRAEMLHREEIEADPTNPEAVTDKVLFVPFTGVAPRQYPRLFSMSGRGRKSGLALNAWEEKRTALGPRYLFANAAYAYTHTEREEVERLPTEYDWERSVICPT